MTRLARPALIALILALYWPSLSLPLSFDDAWSVRLVREFTLLDLFTQTQNFGYYRPLYLAYYRLAAAVGASGPLLLHALCIAAHAANALLLLRLTPALLDGTAKGVAFAAALLFALNPFAVQAVALPAGLNHLLALLFIQLAMLCYVQARGAPTHGAPTGLQHSPRRTARQVAAWVACLGLCSLAFLANEIGVCVVGFALAYEAMRARRLRRWTRDAWSWLIIAAWALAYVAIYAGIPKGASPEFVPTIGDGMTRGLIALQTLTYPLTLVLGALGLAAEPAVLVAAAMLLVICGVALRGPHGDAVLLGGLLFITCVALPVLRLPTGYIQNAPRVFYTSATGTAMVWAAVVLSMSALLGPDMALRPLAGAVVAAVGLAGAWHALDHQRFLAWAHEPVRVLVESAAQIAPDETVLMINAPEWVAAPARRFPLFHEGAIVLAAYVEGRDLVLANAGLDRDVHLAQVALPGDPSRPYAFMTFGRPLDPTQLVTAARVLQTDYLLDALRTEWIGGATTHRPESVEVTFADGLALVRHYVQPCREGWIVTLQWRRTADGADGRANHAMDTLSAFVQALDRNEAKLAQHDGAPLRGMLSFAQLPEDRDIMDRRVLRTSETAEAMLLLGLYDYRTGMRLAARDARGNRLPGDALATPLSLPDAQTSCR